MTYGAPINVPELLLVATCTGLGFTEHQIVRYWGTIQADPIPTDFWGAIDARRNALVWLENDDLEASGL